MRSLPGFSLVVCMVTLLSACGGGGGGATDTTNNTVGDTTVNVNTGAFIDSPVSGLIYQSNTYSGVTDGEGNFQYLPGEIVQFSLGGIVLGQAEAADTISPYDLFPYNAPENKSRFNNLLRLLQSLDEDCNPNNGITLNEAVSTQAKMLSIPLPDTVLEFENSLDLKSLLEKSSCATAWVTPLQAETHLHWSMGELLQPRLEKIAVLTLEGETEPSLAIDADGNSIFVMPGDTGRGESSRIITRSATNESVLTSLDESGFPKGVFFPNGTIILMQNHTAETVDVIIDIPENIQEGYSAARVSKRIVLSDKAKAAYFSIVPPAEQVAGNKYQSSTISLAQLDKDSNLSVFEHVFTALISSAYADDVTQVLSQQLINAANAMKYLQEISDDIGSHMEEVDALHGYFVGAVSGRQYFSNIATSVINSAIEDAAKNSLPTLNQDGQRVVNLTEQTLGCAAGSLVSCVQADIEGIRATIELGGVLYDIYKDSDRIAAILAELALVNWDEVPPIIILNSPYDGESFAKGDLIILQGNAFDLNEDHIPDTRIFWKSNIQGDLGTGRMLSIVDLSPGMHVITVTVEAIDGVRVSRRVTIEVGNEAPVATIVTPSSATSYITGADVTLSGTGIDPEDGTLTGVNLEWRSSWDNRFLGTGSTIFVNDLFGPAIGDALTSYKHTIMLTAIDQNGKKDTDSIEISITNAQPPSINITNTVTTYVKEVGDLLVASGRKSNGDSVGANSVLWQSNIDGDLGYGLNLSVSNLSVGTHTITVTVTDAEQTATDSIMVTVTSLAPEFEILTPDGATASDGNFKIRTDIEQGHNYFITWRSSIDGAIWQGDFMPEIEASFLSVGTHTITVKVLDDLGTGYSASKSITLHVLNSRLPPYIYQYLDPSYEDTVSSYDLGDYACLHVNVIGQNEDNLYQHMPYLSTDSVSWLSDIDGPLASTGEDLTTNALSEGYHTLTVTGSDLGVTSSFDFNVSIVSSDLVDFLIDSTGLSDSELNVIISTKKEEIKNWLLGQWHRDYQNITHNYTYYLDFTFEHRNHLGIVFSGEYSVLMNTDHQTGEAYAQVWHFIDVVEQSYPAYIEVGAVGPVSTDPYEHVPFAREIFEEATGWAWDNATFTEDQYFKVRNSCTP